MRLVRRQLGLFTTRQAEELGVAREALLREVELGRLARWHRGVYTLAGMMDSLDRRILAAHLACGPASMASHATAATLHDLIEVPDATAIDLLLPRPRRRPRAIAGVTIHTTVNFLPEHRTNVGPIPVTCVPRTICNLANRLSPARQRRMICDAWRRGLTTPGEVAACLDRLGPISGARRLRGVLDSLTPQLARARSVAGSEAFHALEVRGLPLPEVNFEVRRPDGSLRYVLDLAWPSLLYDVEIDGDRHHSLAPDREEDRVRDAELATEGWTVRRIPAATVLQRPAAFARQVHDDLRRLGYRALA